MMALSLLAGLFATYCMDFVAMNMIRKQVIKLDGVQVVPSLLGRWTIAILKGYIFHQDIRQCPPFKDEIKVGIIMHYAIGMVLAIIFSLLRPIYEDHFITTVFLGISYGLVTSILPWFIMYPSMGFGILARKLDIKKHIVMFSLINHLVFGLSLGLTIAVVDIGSEASIR